MRQDHNVALALRDAHRRLTKIEPLCNPAERTSPSDALPFSLGSCSDSCLTPCGFRTCAVGSNCICMNSLPCQNLALGYICKVVCQSSAVCCTHHKMLVCQHQCTRENVYVARAGNVPGVQAVQMKHASILHLCNACQTCHSPASPSASPMLLETENKMGINKCVSCKDQESAGRSKPAPLLLQPTGTSEDHLLQSDALQSDEHSETNQEQSKPNCRSFLGEVTDTFIEKDFQPNEREQTPETPHTSQHSNPCDPHLTEIITTVLHSSSDKEYNLKELFEQGMATERCSPQTRSRRRQELAALSLSPDLSASRRQSLQVKRDLARLDPSACRRKLEMDQDKCPKTIQLYVPPTSSMKEQSSVPESRSETKSLKQPKVNSRSRRLPRSNSERLKAQQEQEKQPIFDWDSQQPGLSDKKSSTKAHQNQKKQAFQPSNNVGRSRRNIVPPQRFSSYVTEPRKMFYAACFSEGIFDKHSPNISTASECDSAKMICTPKRPIKSEAQVCEMENNNSGENNVSKQAEQNSFRTEGDDDHVTPTKKLRLCRVRNLTKSQSPKLVQGQSAETNRQENNSMSSAYVSPIKLMLVSCVKGEDGVKYSLKSADSGSNPNGEMFDPCVEASWTGISETKQTQNKDSHSDLMHNDEHVGSKMKPPQVVSVDRVDLIDLTNRVCETSPAVQEAALVKKRPGRPKKLGPQIEKLVKRPIGRPPKVKSGDSNCLNCENINQKRSEENSKEDENKNLKITILYGRSRKSRRVVSEDLERLSLDQHTGEALSSPYEGGKMITGRESMLNPTKGQFGDLHFVKPVEDRKGFIHASSNIKCQKQSDLAVVRKPGRPAKVKISGISVTVTTVSPRQRKIHLKKDMKESQRRALVMEFEPSKEQMTINKRTDMVLDDEEGTTEEGPEHSRTSFVPIRHSVRERKPSVHLLHSVATARSFSRSNALVCRSHKLLMSKANNTENNHPIQRGTEVAAKKTQRKTTHRDSHMKNAIRFSGVSVDSIFALDDRFKWWSTSASTEILNKELARRIRLMSDTWVSEVMEAKRSEEVKMRQKPKDPNSDEQSSAVKRLFERSYNMEKLSSWFMQTTETQSLSIVKKASARNPYEVFHYSPIISPCRENVCPSPQAERLKKHVKKFAQVIPKSPTVHRQALTYETRRSFAKRLLFSSSRLNLRHVLTQRTHKSCGSWSTFKIALHRAKSKFTSNAKKLSTSKVKTDRKNCKGHLKSRVKTTGLSKELHQSKNEVQDKAGVSENKLPKSTKPDASEQVMRFTGAVKEQRIGSKAWSPETLKECRVFLKKINSPNSTSVTVHTCSPVGFDVRVEQEEQKSSANNKLQKSSRSSPRKAHSPPDTPSKKDEKYKRSRASASSPAKRTRQSRSSRGVLAAKWSDFVIGPSR